MQHLGPTELLDSNGQPFPDHIQHVLDKLSPRLRREFPVLQDDVALIEVLEEAGRRIAAREARGGPIDRLHGYAWVTLRSVATTHIRRGQIRLIQNAVQPTSAAARRVAMPSAAGGVEAIERNVLFREVLDVLSQDEQEIVVWRISGHSSAEVARLLGRSIDAVDKVFSRAKQKARRVLGVKQS